MSKEIFPIMYQYNHKNIHLRISFVFQYVEICFLQNHEFLFVIVTANKRSYKIN